MQYVMILMVVHMNHAIFYYLLHPYQLLGKNVFAVEHEVLFFFNSNIITCYYDLYRDESDNKIWHDSYVLPSIS